MVALARAVRGRAVSARAFRLVTSQAAGRRARGRRRPRAGARRRSGRASARPARARRCSRARRRRARARAGARRSGCAPGSHSPVSRVDEHGVEAVADRPPAVLVDHVGRVDVGSTLAARRRRRSAETRRLAERHERGGVVERTSGRRRSETRACRGPGAGRRSHQRYVRSGKSPPAAPQETKAAKSCQVAKAGGMPARGWSSTSFSRVEASRESAPSKNGEFAASAASSGR